MNPSKRGIASPAPIASSSAATLTTRLTVFFAASIGILVMNLFVAQTLTGPIAATLGLPANMAGVAAMLPQLGYALGLILLVPLVDLYENRRLIVCQLGCCAACLLLAMVASSGAWYLTAVFLAGATTCAIQMLVPIVAQMAPEAVRGRVVGNIMSGLMVGILLARPLASFIADLAGWRTLYAILACGVAIIAVMLYLILPKRQPSSSDSYRTLIGSLWRLLRDEPILRQRSVTAALAMGAFSAFWTSVGQLLAEHPFQLTQRDIALFAFAGAAGAIIAPLAGRAGDRGRGHAWSVGGHLVAMSASVLALFAGAGAWGNPALGIALLVAAAIFLDAGVTADQTIGRRAVNLLNPAARGRMNGLFVGLFFVGGALGSVVSGVAWARGGWTWVCIVQFAFSAAGLLMSHFGRQHA